MELSYGGPSLNVQSVVLRGYELCLRLHYTVCVGDPDLLHPFPGSAVPVCSIYTASP